MPINDPYSPIIGLAEAIGRSVIKGVAIKGKIAADFEAKTKILTVRASVSGQLETRIAPEIEADAEE